MVALVRFSPRIAAAFLVAGPVLAQTAPLPTTEAAAPAVVGQAPFSRMHMILEKTIFKVDVMALDVCVDATTAAGLARIVGQRRSDQRDDAIADLVIAAPRAAARIRFLRRISLDQFLNGIREEQRKAVEADLLPDSVHQMITDSLPHWFMFLEDRGILDGDRIFYEFRGDTLRTVYVDPGGVTMLDQADLGYQRRTSVLATYFAPGSGFRRRLIESLESAETPPSDASVCGVASRTRLDGGYAVGPVRE